MMSINPSTLAALRREAVEASDLTYLSEYKELVEEHISKSRSEKSRAGRVKLLLRPDLGPIVMDGNPLTARVIHLKANPSYGDDATRDTHYQPHSDWQLSVAGPHIARETRDYYQNKVFIHLKRGGVTTEEISMRMLKLELCPWASKSWPTGQKKLLDALNKFPSRLPTYSLLSQLVDQGAIVIIARAAKIWLENVPALRPLVGSRVFVTRSEVAPWISQGAFPEGWHSIVSALKGK